MKPPAKAVRVTSGRPNDAPAAVDESRDVAQLMFDRIHAHDAAEAGPKALLARKAGAKKVKARRR